MLEPQGPFWERVRLYRSLGLDPLKWIAGCSVEVEAEAVLLPAVSAARPALADLATTAEPGGEADLFEARERPRPAVRCVVRPHEGAKPVRTPTRANPHRAALLMRVHSARAASPEAFSAALTGFIAGLPSQVGSGAGTLNLNAPITIGQLHAVTTPDSSSEFVAVDFYHGGDGEAVGYGAASCESLQVTDPTLDPLSPQHVESVVAGALAPLCAVGAVDDPDLLPAFDAAGRKAQDAIAASFAEVARRHGLRLAEREPLGTSKLFIGATLIGHTDRDPPGRHHYVKRGMQVTLTRPLGDLAPLATYLACMADPDYAKRAESAGFGLEELAKRRKVSADALTTPALREGRVVHDFSPPFREVPDLAKHIAATADLGTAGLIGCAGLAARFAVDIRVDALPLCDPEVSHFATEARLMDNATASAPGAIAVVAYPAVLDEVERALEAKGGRPMRVATIVSRGSPGLRAPARALRAISSAILRQRLSVA